MSRCRAREKMVCLETVVPVGSREIQQQWHPARLLVCCLLLLGASGCRSANFRATNLPDQFRVPPAPGDVTANLAHLSGPGQSETLISPGDKLSLVIASGYDAERNRPQLIRVSEDGSLEVPLVGPVAVTGMDVMDASRAIAKASVERGIYRQPHVAVDIEKKAMNRITVMGAVKKPGVHEVPRSSSDLLHALAMAGGMNEDAGTEVEILKHQSESGHTRLAHDASEVQETQLNSSSGEIQLAAYSQLEGGAGHSPGTLEAGPVTERIDLASLMKNGTKAHGNTFQLADRDVVLVPPTKKRTIHVGGLVKRPGQYELPRLEDVHLLDALALAGGVNSEAADKVLIIRRVEGKERPLLIRASIAEAKHNGRENLRLAVGDMVSIERTPATVIVDTLSRFIRMSVGISGRTVFF